MQNMKKLVLGVIVFLISFFVKVNVIVEATATLIKVGDLTVTNGKYN